MKNGLSDIFYTCINKEKIDNLNINTIAEFVQ